MPRELGFCHLWCSWDEELFSAFSLETSWRSVIGKVPIISALNLNSIIVPTLYFSGQIYTQINARVQWDIYREIKFHMIVEVWKYFNLVIISFTFWKLYRWVPCITSSNTIDYLIWKGSMFLNQYCSFNWKKKTPKTSTAQVFWSWISEYKFCTKSTFKLLNIGWISEFHFSDPGDIQFN